MADDKPYSVVYYHDVERRLNVSVVADRILFAGEPRYGCTLALLSALGPHSAVRGILAAAASGREIRSDAYPMARFYGSEGGRILTSSLTREVTHGCYLAPDLLLSSTGRTAILDPTPRKVYDRLTYQFAIPTLPEWADWLYKALEKSRELSPLSGKGASGVVIQTSEERLDALIADGVKSGALRL